MLNLHISYGSAQVREFFSSTLRLGSFEYEPWVSVSITHVECE